MRLPDGSETEGVLPLRGQFQLANLEAAVAACWYFVRDERPQAVAGNFLRGLELVDWPGRLEIFSDPRGRMLIVDGAHCPLSARALGREVRRLLEGQTSRRFLLLLAMQRDKDTARFLENFISHVGQAELHGVVAYGIDGPRGATGEELAARASAAGFPATAAHDAADAIQQGVATGVHLVATGSLYTIEAIKAAWRSSAP
jgi:folylpolyglutamate synthase/dihydropteroate synthase